MAKQSSFSIGDIVKLKSGGPDMTVQSLRNDKGNLYCQWFAGKKLEQGLFPADSLEFVKEEKTK